MAKIYNEIIIDMNPESSTFEETLFEDSYDYNGNLMLMQDPREEDGGSFMNTGQTSIYGQSQNINNPGVRNIRGVSDRTTSYGLESLTMDSFFDESNKPLPLNQIVDKLLQHKPWDKSMDVSEEQYRRDMEKKVYEFMPKLQSIDQEQLKFLKETKGLAAEERSLAKKKAEDKYGRAEDTYGLTTRAAERGLGTALGQAQGQASSLGGAMRSAYGGSSMGMRGAIGGQQTLAKGVESTYGGFQDKMIGAQQALGYAGQELDYAETAGGIAAKEADLAYRTGEEGLKQDVEKEFESDFSTFFEDIGEYKKGGLVPHKGESFSEVLSKLPDAGGS